MPRIPLFIFLIFFCLSFGLEAGESKEVPSTVPPIRIAYFVPADREPLPDRQERLGRVMRYVQDFYRKEMQKNGYGPKTFVLEWDKPDRLKLYLVKGKKKQAEYGRNDASVVREEVRNALRSQYGIEVNEEVTVIFQLLLNWDGAKATEVGPYVGGGSHLTGTAWVYEDAKLDSDLLSSKEPGGYYHGPCSLGRFNTHYIGGLAHEMGHAFSLPHACELDAERKEKGRALMGGGNHTFGQELRNEGPGTFLAASSAMRLSKVRAFVGDIRGSRERVYWIFEELNAVPKKKNSNGSPRSFVLTGRVTATPKLIGIIAYNDNGTIPADYDAKTWTAPIGADGSFRIEIDELAVAPYQLRLVGIHETGATSRLVIDYSVAPDGIELSAINSAVPLDNLKRLFCAGNKAEIEVIARKNASNKNIESKARHLLRLLNTMETVEVSRLPSSVRETDLSWADFLDAKTGWGSFRRAHVPEDVFLQVGGKFFDSGLYAHAPASYKIELGAAWRTFRFGYGLQDGHDGPVRFVVRGDGKELFRSGDIKDHKEHRETVSVDSVGTLELVVESAAPNGNSGAWGVWLCPVLKR